VAAAAAKELVYVVAVEKKARRGAVKCPKDSDVVGKYVRKGTHIVAKQTTVVEGVTRVQFEHDGVVGWLSVLERDGEVVLLRNAPESLKPVPQAVACASRQVRAPSPRSIPQSTSARPVKPRRSSRRTASTNVTVRTYNEVREKAYDRGLSLDGVVVAQFAELNQDLQRTCVDLIGHKWERRGLGWRATKDAAFGLASGSGALFSDASSPPACFGLICAFCSQVTSMLKAVRCLHHRINCTRWRAICSAVSPRLKKNLSMAT
jgi:hypothetical protein